MSPEWGSELAYQKVVELKKCLRAQIIRYVYCIFQCSRIPNEAFLVYVFISDNRGALNSKMTTSSRWKCCVFLYVEYHTERKLEAPE